MTTVREATFDFLRRQGMTTVFGNPGSTELPFLDAVPGRLPLRARAARGRGVGVADGYAQASGRPALVNLHTAPGVGNGDGGDLQRAGQQVAARDHRRQQARSLMTLQAILTNRDAARMPHPLVKWSYEPPRAEDVPHAIARATHLAALPPRGPVFVSIPMDDWREEVDDDAAAHQTRPRGHRPPGADPDAGARARAAARGGRRTRCWSPARTSTRAGPADAAVELAERARLPVWATPATGGGRIGFPEGHPHFQGVLPPAVGPLGDTLAGHDLILVVGSSVFAYYPNIPGPLLPDGASLVAITSDPDEAARAPMGDAIVADVKLTLEALLAHVEAPERARRPSRAPRPEPPEDDGSDERLGRHRRARRRLPGRRRRSCPSRPPPRSRFATACGSRGPARYYFAAGGGLGFALPASIGVQMARAGPARGVRARRGLGAVRDPGAVDRGRLRRAGHVPRPAQRGVRDPQVVRRDRAGHRRARPRPAALEVAAVAEGYGVPSTRVDDAGALREVLRDAISASGPRLVEARVAPGMALPGRGDATRPERRTMPSPQRA